MKPSNIFSEIPDLVKDEIFGTILKSDHFALERIISSGQATPPGKWYEQPTDEWVILLKGSAGLLFEGQEEVRVLHPGDYVHILARQRHRVEWTEGEEKPVWLAVHYLVLRFVNTVTYSQTENRSSCSLHSAGAHGRGQHEVLSE